MQSNDADLADKLAMALSGGLLLLGVVVTGLIETFDGAPRSPATVTNDAGEVIAQPTIDPNIRTALVVAALLVLLVYAVYRLAVPRVEARTSSSTADTQPSD